MTATSSRDHECYPGWLYKARNKREAARWARMSTAGSDIGAGPTAADDTVSDGDAVASSNFRGLSHEPEGEESSQWSPKRNMTKLRTNFKDAIRVKGKRLKENRRNSKPGNSSRVWLFFDVHILARLQKYAICTLLS